MAFQVSPAQQPSPPLGAGTCVAGRYRLVRRLASGGTADVFLAEDLSLGEHVAVKVARSLADAPLLREEALALRRARHAGVVLLFDAGQLPDGRSYLVMDFVRGGNLASLLARRGPLGAAAVLDLLRPLARALDHVHAVGLVHRDIKPGNILVDEHGAVKLCDFGFALDAAQASAPRRWVEGTVGHMAPEQASGGPLTGAADRWALAALAHQCLTGVRPDPAASASGVMPIAQRVRRSERDRWSGNVALARVFARALSDDPDARPPTATDFVEQLAQALRPSRRTATASHAA